MTTYSVTDGKVEVEIDASSPREAAEEYAQDGDWGDDEQITVYVRDDEGRLEIVTVDV